MAADSKLRLRARSGGDIATTLKEHETGALCYV